MYLIALRLYVIIVECLSKDDDVEYSEATYVEREMLVNINCPIRMMLDYIRKVARMKGKSNRKMTIIFEYKNTSFLGEYDLCDEINCQLKSVSFHEPHIRGTDILEPDVTYIIVTFDSK